MKLLLDSFWRAVAYCLHPRVMLLSLLPLAVMLVLGVGLGYFYWDSAHDAVQQWLNTSSVVNALLGVLEQMGLSRFGQVLAPLLLILMVTPLLVIGSLLLVALLLTPAVLKLVAARRFAQLERLGNTSLLASLGWSLGHTVLALAALVVSLPLWFVPPLVLLLPPLIWGWLTYRVMSFDALAEHATPEERRALLRQHRWPLLLIGVACGYLGAAPGVVWASFALFAVAFALLIPVGIWIYTLVFAFSSLWFSHYCLAALAAQRARAEAALRPDALPDPGAATPVALP